MATLFRLRSDEIMVNIGSELYFRSEYCKIVENETEGGQGALVSPVIRACGPKSHLESEMQGVVMASCDLWTLKICGAFCASCPTG